MSAGRMLICGEGFNGSRCPMIEVFILIFASISTGLCDWPEGTYGIPAPRDGCPSNDGVYQWKLGSVLQVTEQGTHTSGNVHMYGMTDGPTNRVCQTFCMKVSYGSDRKHHFMPGKYCILKLNQCPPRFQEGWIYWDDAGPLFWSTVQNSSGFLPDGDYNRNTRIEYCCRLDGDASDKIILPTNDPFYLLKYGELCQEVEGMDVVEEWIYWAGEKSYNQDSERGVYPRVERQKGLQTYTKLFYCYYTPKPRAVATLTLGSGFETFLTALCIIGAALAMIFLVAVILATIQKALITRKRCRQQRQSHPPATNARNERISERQACASTKTKPLKGSNREYSGSCKTSAIASKSQNIRLETVKDSCKKSDAPIQTTPATMDDQLSVDSINWHPDVESEAPPSYDEVLRDGNLNFIM